MNKLNKYVKGGFLAATAFLAVFLFLGCSEKPTYEDGYEDGYADGQLDPLYPKDITTEYVKNNPETYCGEYATEFCENHLKHLDTLYKCQER